MGIEYKVGVWLGVVGLEFFSEPFEQPASAAEVVISMRTRYGYNARLYKIDDAGINEVEGADLESLAKQEPVRKCVS